MAEHAPSAGELTAHVRTAVDGTVRWLDRMATTPADDPEGWHQRGFYARMMLMRGMERGDLLGWVLQRDALAEGQSERGAGLRRATAYWSEARPELHTSLDALRRELDFDPHSRPARDQVQHARDRLEDARGWLTDLATALAESSRTVQRDREPQRPPPDTSLGLDLL